MCTLTLGWEVPGIPFDDVMLSLFFLGGTLTVVEGYMYLKQKKKSVSCMGSNLNFFELTYDVAMTTQPANLVVSMVINQVHYFQYL
jgi:hypothetical protein